ncbi:hypothetical protein BH24ACT12_BH24ACT12_25200 [soil metagenome]
MEASVLGAEALPLGKSVQVRLAIADPASRRVVFELDG